MNNENWLVSPIDEHNRLIDDVNTDYQRLTRLLDHGVFSYEDYRKGVLMNANKLIGFLKEERRPET